MNTSQRTLRHRSLRSLFAISAACGSLLFTSALAGPIPAGLDSYRTLDGSLDASVTQVPAGFFDPASDPFLDTVPLQGSPLGPGATTDTVVRRLSSAKFKGPPPKTAIVPVEIVALSLTSPSPITVTYHGGQDPELWNVRAGLSPSSQPPGSMTLSQNGKDGGAFDLSLPVLMRLTFTRVADGAMRVLDLPALDLLATVVPWTSTTTTADLIHSPDFCPACDSPDGDPANLFAAAQGTQLNLVPAATLP